MESALRKKRMALVYYVSVLSIFLTGLFLVSVVIGSSGLSLEQVIGSLLGLNQDKLVSSIVFGYRIPRILFALLTGFILGVAGAVMQALTRNPLADPFISGMSGGAAVGAAFALTLPMLPLFSIPIFAFIGGVGMLALSLAIARKAGGGSMSFILAGIAVGTMANAFLMIIISMNRDVSHGILYWIFGSFSTTSWSDLQTTFLIVAPAVVLIFWWAKDLNILLMGEDHARQLGLNARFLWNALLVLSSVAVAACVSYCGIIGFIGLVAPHIVRLVVGSDNRFVMPLAGFTGALLMLVADDIVRLPNNILSEIPVGSITSMIGVPVFIYLLIKKGKTIGM